MSATTYWVHDGGETICDQHAGAYLTGAINNKPNAKTHRTPLGTWEQLTSDDIAYFTNKGIPCCETCR